MAKIRSALECPVCHGERWVNDQNWSASDPGLYFKYGDAIRTAGDGRIPCGRCNLAGWNVPDRRSVGGDNV